jgi:hypothetical protein
MTEDIPDREYVLFAALELQIYAIFKEIGAK